MGPKKQPREQFLYFLAKKQKQKTFLRNWGDKEALGTEPVEK